MGYRIELNEIELAINEIKHVNEAIVFFKSDNENKKIIGVVASKKSISNNYIYNEVEKRLPSYMIPSNIYLVKNLLKNANGKIDRVKIANIYGKKQLYNYLSSIFGIPINKIKPDLKINSIRNWDSLKNMQLIFFFRKKINRNLTNKEINKIKIVKNIERLINNEK